MTLMEKLKEAGYPEADIHHHCSDLYVYATPLTKQVINAHFKETGQNRSLFVKPFKDAVTGRPMYDIAFHYDPAWSGGAV